MTEALPPELRDGKVGRFPIWAVALVLAAGAVLFFMWFRNRGKADTGDTTSSGEPLVYDGSTDTVDGLPPGAIGNFLDQNPLDPAYPVGLTPGGIPGPVTNVQWSRLAFDYLVGQGNDPSLVERALAKYIQGSALTAAERAVVNLAQVAFGAPPEGLINSPTVPPVTTPGTITPGPTSGTAKPSPSPKPAIRRFVIVARYRTPNPPWNSTLSGIAAHYNRTVAQLVSWNHIRNPNLIYTGQKIYVDPA